MAPVSHPEGSSEHGMGVAVVLTTMAAVLTTRVARETRLGID